MNKRELIETIDNLQYTLSWNIPRINKESVIDLINQLDEPQPLKLKDIISRMKQLFPLSRAEWIDEILKEFGEEFGSIKYRSGYEQGKLEGIVEREKVTIPQFVADWIEECKAKGIALGYALYCSKKASDKKTYGWVVKSLDNQETFARAWLDGYEVEKEPKYTVKIKSTKCSTISLVFSESTDVWLFSATIYQGLRFKHTRKQLEEADFGWVFDCEGIEVEEVE